MAVVNPPTWLENGTYTADNDRLVTALLVERNTDGIGNSIGSNGGVTGGKNQFTVTANGTMNLTVSSGVVVVPRSNLSAPGVYLCNNNGDVTVAVPTQSSGQRNDMLVARVNDSQDGNTGDNWELFLVTGPTFTSTPVDPTVAVNYVKLARVNVKSAALNGGVDKIATAQLTDLRTWVAAPGGVHMVWNGNYPPNQPGRLAYDTTPNVGLKIGLGGGVWWTLVPDELRAFRTAIYSTRSAYFDNTVDKSAFNAGSWDATPPLDDGTGPLPEVNLVASGYYTPTFKVTISALGKCDDAQVSGHMSVQVRDGTTEIYPPAIGRGPSFYGTFWQTGENTFIVPLSGTYIKRGVNFRVMFRSGWTGSGDGANHLVRFQRIRLIVEPTVI